MNVILVEEDLLQYSALSNQLVNLSLMTAMEEFFDVFFHESHTKKKNPKRSLPSFSGAEARPGATHPDEEALQYSRQQPRQLQQVDAVHSGLAELLASESP